MFETDDELAHLQEILDASIARATDHLRGIIKDERTLNAREISQLTTGMRTLAVSTVTATGEPRISALDGHFLHGNWIFTTSGSAAKTRHLRARPAVSAAWIDGEEVAIFAHGHAAFVPNDSDEGEQILAHLTAHYGSSPLEWGPDIVICRVNANWMVGYAFEKERVLAERATSS